MYGKLTNDTLIMAPKVIEIDGRVFYNPDEGVLRGLGYLPIEVTPCPDDGLYSEGWQESDGKLIQTWAPCDNTSPENQVMTPEERLCQAESELASLKLQNELLTAEVMYLCMMNGIEPTEV